MAKEPPQPNSNVVSLVERKGLKMRKPFTPSTGNPENADYLDYYRHLLETGDDVFDFPPE